MASMPTAAMTTTPPTTTAAATAVEVATPQDILDFWVGGDQTENYRTKWFPPDASDKQREMDALIATRFGATLRAAEQGELRAWQDERDTCVALILVLDQFSRHVYRHENKEQLRANDAQALALAHELVARGWHVDLDIPKFVFVLMPIRHTPTAASLHELLATIETRKVRQDGHVDLLDKFRRTTQNRLQHLRGDTVGTSDDDILERHFVETDESGMTKERLYRAMDEFLTKMQAQQHSHLAVSLSGGVDSMVVAYLLHQLRPRYNHFTIVAVHIDYGNREESAAECEYVRSWCARFGIVFHVRRIDEVTRGKTKRDDYERISRDIRYSTYAQVMAEYNIPGMCFGHHRGDVQENVISNMMKGLSLLNLNGMSETSVVNKVNIWRPLLAFDKDVIFDFAHRYGVPYFKDTTPAWSTRGKLRNQLVPLLRDMYGDGFLNNLSNLGAESTQCGELIDRSILSPIMATVGSTQTAVWLDCTKLIDQPFFMWKEVLRSICHGLMGNSMIREKPTRELIHKLARHNGTPQWVVLKKGNRSFLTADRVLLIFRDRFFPRVPYVAPGTSIELGQTYTFGPWTVTTTLVDGDSDVVARLSSAKPLVMWDLVRNDGVEYVIPQPQKLVICCEKRIAVLRALEKQLTDVMPLVAAHNDGDGDAPASASASVASSSTGAFVHVVLRYANS